MNTKGGITQLTGDAIKQEVLKTSSWIISLNRDDIKILNPSRHRAIFFEVVTGKTTAPDIKQLIDNIRGNSRNVNQDNCLSVKLLIHLQLPRTTPTTMEAMMKIRKFANILIPSAISCEVLWGLSLREDNICRAICAVWAE